jgi:hypothetical protein
LAPEPDDIPSLLTAMHDINKLCSYLLVFIYLFLVYILFFKLYNHESNQINIFFMSTENSHVSTNLLHTLYRMQSIGTMPLTSFRMQLDPKSYKRCEEKSVETWHSLTRPIFLDYIYSVSSSTFATMYFMFIHLHFTLHLYILINFEFCLIFQQELIEASDIALNHYNETRPLERTSQCYLLVLRNN